MRQGCAPFLHTFRHYDQIVFLGERQEKKNKTQKYYLIFNVPGLYSSEYLSLSLQQMAN